MTKRGRKRAPQIRISQVGKALELHINNTKISIYVLNLFTNESLTHQVSVYPNHLHDITED